MKSKQFECLLGGVVAPSMSPDAQRGLNVLASKLAAGRLEDDLFDSALRRASDEELRQLARFRLQTQSAKYLD